MELDMKQLIVAVRAIAEEKNLPEETVQEIVEQALAAAYRRDYGDREQEVRVTMNMNSGVVDAYVSKEVVEQVGDERFEMSLGDAQVIRKNAKVGEMVEVHEKVENFGRVAAQQLVGGLVVVADLKDLFAGEQRYDQGIGIIARKGYSHSVRSEIDGIKIILFIEQCDAGT